MVLILLLLFIIVPTVEIALFIEVGGEIGILPTVLLTFATAVAGTAMLRIQGLGTLRRAEAAMARDEPPVAELVDGIGLLLAGLLLLIPGFATDAIGLLLFVPPVRQLLARRILKGVKARRRGRQQESDIIEGDFERIEEPDGILPPQESKWRGRL